MKQLGRGVGCYNDYIDHNNKNNVTNKEGGANGNTNVVDTLG